MTKEELEILRKAEEIKKKRLEEKKRLKKIQLQELKIKRNEQALKEKNERLLREAEKKRIFDLNFPTFEEKKNEINQEITILEKQLMQAKIQKEKLMTEFRPFCVHKYGEETYTKHYGAFTYVDCIHCGYQNCIHEVSC